MISPRLGAAFVVSCVALALFKLWLVRGDEVACPGSPFDDIWYIQSAKDWYWLRSYRDMPFGTAPYIRLPAFPIYVALVNLTGIPLRVADELLFVFAAFVFTWVLIKAGLSRFLCVLLYAAIVFHPVSFSVNNMVGTDVFYAPVLLFALAGLILLYLRREHPRRLRYALAAGSVLAILWHVRQESFLLLFLLAFYGLLSLAASPDKVRPWAHTLKRLGVLVAVPAAVILAASMAVKTVNYFRFGVFAADAMSTSDFADARTALLRIKPAKPIRNVPVTREARRRAYEVSPAFRELQPYFEGDPGNTWAVFGQSVGVGPDTPGEISAGHFWWALNEATYRAGYNKSARQADRFYRRVADEINAACADGRLQCRFVFSSLVDPHVQNYLPHLPGSFMRMVGVFTWTNAAPKPQDMPNLPTDVRALVDAVANRRRPVVASIRGWASDSKDQLRSVRVRTEDGRVLAHGHFTPRQDVAAALASEGNASPPLYTGFELEFPAADSGASNADIVFTTEGGEELVIHRPGANASGAGERLVYNIDIDDGGPAAAKHKSENSIQRLIWAAHGRLIRLLSYAGLCALLLLLVFRRSVKIQEPIFAVMALLAAAIVIRAAFFTFIDASAYIAATDIRYVFPVMYLYTCVTLMLIATSLRVISSRVGNSHAWRKFDFRKSLGRTAGEASQAKEVSPAS